MPDYQSMYAKLFQSQTKAIRILQEAQQATEDMYIESEPPDIRMLPKLKDESYPNPSTSEEDDKND